MLPFALTIFTGAFLLFQVQPLIGKFILPWFGGAPGVWTACLLFVQTVLLGGYAYAHFLSTRFKPRQQVIIHIVLLLLSLAVMPIAPSETWKTHVAGDPTWRILLLLTVSIGLPYFVLSSTGPLMQQWFSQTNPGVSPYRLYALSNVGSLLALLSYPAYFEVKFTRHAQATMWSVGLGLFVIFCGYCAWVLWKRVVTTSAATDATAGPTSDAPVEKTSGVDKLLWVSLPAIASILLLSTTNKLCQEIAVIPFLWVLPLSLYLLTFIICFDHARWYNRWVFLPLLVVSVAVVAALLPAGTDAPMRLQIVGYTTALFVACMVCHGELYRLKPPVQSLTSYYLLISAGGALGGFLVAVVAPAVFNEYRELQIGFWVLSYLVGVLCYRHRSRELVYALAIGGLVTLVALPAVRAMFDDSTGFKAELIHIFTDTWMNMPGWAYVLVSLAVLAACMLDFKRWRLLPEWQPRSGWFAMYLCVALGAIFTKQWAEKSSVPVLSATRNFYGTLKVFDYYAGDPEDNYHLLLHGATTHGLQFTSPEKSVLATSYYGENSGVGRAINRLPQTPRKLGLVGLGTGTLATYARPGDTMRIYEINPEVERLAREQFKYLSHSPGKIDVAMGDARLVMEQEVARGELQGFDLLALDAFSSDAIPVHLLTKEAFAIYMKQIKPDGVIAVHISNRYLDLRPIVERLAAEFGLEVVSISDDDEPQWWVYATTWMILTK
ncbi:MAG TPA: fused MFS/spermidine synthase, partial [Opitutaceae bacterium]